jgi:hypothetical protein
MGMQELIIIILILSILSLPVMVALGICLFRGHAEKARGRDGAISKTIEHGAEARGLR